MEFHPIANVFPLIEGDGYRSLVEDIRKHGLLEPVTLYEGKILDGRNRYRACMEAGAAVRSQDWQGEGGSPAEFVWSKNAERRQLSASQRAMAAQALMPWLTREAKSRMLAGKKIDPSPNPEQGPVRPMGDRPGKAAEHAARLAGVGKSIIYDAKKLSDRAQKDPHAANLAEQVRAGAMSVSQATKMLAVDVDRDDADGALRRRRSPVALVATPPREDASDVSKARYASRPVRVLADYLSGLKLDMERQGLTLSDDALLVWWDGVEAREWEQVQASVAWFESTCERLLKFVHYKVARNSVPPMVERLSRQQLRRA